MAAVPTPTNVTVKTARVGAGLVASLIALALFGLGVWWITDEIAEGRAAKADVERLEREAEQLREDALAAKVEAATLQGRLDAAAVQLEETRNEIAARSQQNRVAVRAAVVASPDLARLRLPRELVELLNATRTGGIDGSGPAADRRPPEKPVR